MSSSIDCSPDELRVFLTLQKILVEACRPLWKECHRNASRQPPLVCAYVEHLVSEEARQYISLYDQSEDIKNSKELENLQSEARQVILAALQSGKTID